MAVHKVSEKRYQNLLRHEQFRKAGERADAIQGTNETDRDEEKEQALAETQEIITQGVNLAWLQDIIRSALDNQQTPVSEFLPGMTGEWLIFTLCLMVSKAGALLTVNPQLVEEMQPILEAR